jgi:hypothetical protein
VAIRVSPFVTRSLLCSIPDWPTCARHWRSANYRFLDTYFYTGACGWRELLEIEVVNGAENSPKTKYPTDFMIICLLAEAANGHQTTAGRYWATCQWLSASKNCGPANRSERQQELLGFDIADISTRLTF